MTEIVASPNAPRPADPQVLYIADTLRRIEVRYDTEGSGPGSRFEGRLLEDVQAEAVVRMVREQCAQLAEQRGAEYPDGDDGETCCDAECHFIWKPFGDLLRGRE